jgi:hypothetical protein
MKRIILVTALLAVSCLAAASAIAGPPQKIMAAVDTAYTPAMPHRGLESAYVQPEPQMMRTYVVVEKGGIPVERARYFISWDDYDYRGAVIHLNKGEEITTRRGAPYAYLQRGDVMAVADIKYLGHTVYLKLLSADAYIPENRTGEKRFSRVTVELGFKFPKEVFESDNAEEVLKKLGEWLKPFPNVEAAKAYGGGAREAREVGKPVVAEKPAAAAADDEKLKSLEQKIDEAKKQMDEAEKEMQKLKKENSGKK